MRSLIIGLGLGLGTALVLVFGLIGLVAFVDYAKANPTGGRLAIAAFVVGASIAAYLHLRARRGT